MKTVLLKKGKVSDDFEVLSSTNHQKIQGRSSYKYYSKVYMYVSVLVMTNWYILVFGP